MLLCRKCGHDILLVVIVTALFDYSIEHGGEHGHRMDTKHVQDRE